MPPDWRKLEKAVMQSLGLKPSALSGGGWLEKEDGESDKILAQLKSTAGKSISVKEQDWKDLVRHSRVAHKLPVFVLYFMGDEPYVMVRAGDLQKAARYLKYGVFKADAKGESKGRKRPVNPTNTSKIRGTINKKVRGDNTTIPY